MAGNESLIDWVRKKVIKLAIQDGPIYSDPFPSSPCPRSTGKPAKKATAKKRTTSTRDAKKIVKRKPNPLSQPKRKMSQNIQFKIGMIAPTGVGKTSLIAAINHEVSNRIATEPIQFNPADTGTQRHMKQASATFNTAINNPDNLFSVPKFNATSDISEYQFAVTINSCVQQAIGFSIMDYPGSMLGTAEFAQKVSPHLRESVALLVPISADILMDWDNTKKLKDSFNCQRNMTANMMLDVDNVILSIQDWIGEKKRIGAPAQLFFVPIKCEKHFNDNGGHVDTHEKLHQAILERFIEPLEMDDAAKRLIETNIYYVDTYGVVELRDISTEMQNGNMVLVPTFRRRTDMDKKLKTKNAYELLISILKFQVNNRFNLQKADTTAKVADADASQREVDILNAERDRNNQQMNDRVKSYSWWDSFWYTWIGTDEKLGELARKDKDIGGKITTATSKRDTLNRAACVSQEECKALADAVDTLTGLLKSMPNRQRKI